MRPMSQWPTVLMSVSGERSNSTCSSSSSRRSSMSRKDMWQPKQPASETVATLSLRGPCGMTGKIMTGLLPPAPTRDSHRNAAGRSAITKPCRLGRITPDRADVGRAVVQRHRRVGQPAAGAVDQQVGVNAVAADGKDILAVDIAAGAHAQLAQDAAVQVQQDVGVAGVHRPARVELLEVRAFHAHLVGGGLQQAIAALLATRAEVVALDEQHLQQRLAMAVQLFGVAFHVQPGGSLRRAGAPRAGR